MSAFCIPYSPPGAAAVTIAHSLPPTSRDFLVYERIVIDHATTRQAADEVGLSQTRVRQIVHRVEDYLAAALATEGSESHDRGRLRLAQCLAADRLHELYTDAFERWNATQESKYLTAVLRLITAQSKLAAQPFTIGALAADATEGPYELNGDPVGWAPPTTSTRSASEGQDVGCISANVGCISAAQCTNDVVRISAANSTTAPPTPLASPPTDHGPLTTDPLSEDCSTSPVTGLPVETTSIATAATTPANEQAYNSPPNEQPPVRPRPSTPAQTPPRALPAIAELRLTPASIAMATTESLVPAG